MTEQASQAPQGGAVIEVPLSKLKPSPKNARTTPHGEAAVAALAASIAVKGLLQAPVVEAEVGAGGEPTGCYLVTIGEGRRLALKKLAKDKVIGKAALVRCVLDTTNDPFEISLDENVTRSDMHPADQFEAFHRLAEERGWSAAEIGARFGVSETLVRQRLRLAAVSPRLMAAYRAEEITLDVLMAFAVSDDHARQEQVFEQLTWNRTPRNVRAAMLEAKVPADDRRVLFVGLEAYEAAGGAVLRDLFTEDGGGWLEDVGRLDQLVAAKLAGLAEDLKAREGWKWAEPHLTYPHAHGLARAYPQPVARTPEDEAQIAALSEAYDALVSQWDAVDELPPEIEARLGEIDAALDAFGDGMAYDPGDVARGGVFVVLGHDGQARIERGFIRPEDMTPEPQGEGEEASGDEAGGSGDVAAEEDSAPISERLVLDLTARRTAGLRDTLAQQPDLALVAVIHALALPAFHPSRRASCLEIKAVSAWLGSHAPDIEDTPVGRAIAARHAAWAARVPAEAEGLWDFVLALGQDERMALLAHCAALTVNLVQTPLDRRPAALAQGEVLATAAALDMTRYWAPTAKAYLGQVTKARILDAVAEGVSPEAAARIADLKKPAMAEAAESLLAGTGWLPALLRTAPAREAVVVPLAAE